MTLLEEAEREEALLALAMRDADDAVGVALMRRQRVARRYWAVAAFRLHLADGGDPDAWGPSPLTSQPDGGYRDSERVTQEDHNARGS